MFYENMYSFNESANKSLFLPCDNQKWDKMRPSGYQCSEESVQLRRFYNEPMDYSPESMCSYGFGNFYPNFPNTFNVNSENGYGPQYQWAQFDATQNFNRTDHVLMKESIIENTQTRQSLSKTSEISLSSSECVRDDNMIFNNSMEAFTANNFNRSPLNGSPEHHNLVINEINENGK